jgi:hypothetical protein
VRRDGRTRDGDFMSKGHSMRHGRSRCCAKVGPGSRAHRSAAIVRRQSIRAAEDGEARQVQVQMPNLRRGASPFAGIPETQVPSTTEPAVTWRLLGGKRVPVFDWTGGGTS